MLKAVIFDYDGVIADSFSAACGIINEILQEHGMPVRSQDDYRKIFTYNAKSFFVKLGFGDENLVSALRHFESGMVKHVKMFRGMDAVLKEVKKKYRIALASNAPRDYIEKTINGNLGIFDFTITGDEARPKPNPDQLLACMEKLNVKADETCLVCDMTQDIMAAKAAGLKKVIAVSYGFHGREALSGADVIVNSPQEILRLLNNGI